jgi:hypothetical protein
MLNGVATQFGALVELGHRAVTSARPGRRLRWSRAVENPSRSCSGGLQAFGQRRTTFNRNGAAVRALDYGLMNHARRLLTKEVDLESKPSERPDQRVTTRGASTSGSGVRDQGVASGVSRRDVQPALACVPRSCGGRASGRFLEDADSRWPGGSGSESASSSSRGTSPCRAGHPLAARVDPRRVNRRWSRRPRQAHESRTPGQSVRAAFRHATTRVRVYSAHFTACRARWACAPITSHAVQPAAALPSW